MKPPLVWLLGPAEDSCAIDFFHADDGNVLPRRSSNMVGSIPRHVIRTSPNRRADWENHIREDRAMHVPFNRIGVSLLLLLAAALIPAAAQKGSKAPTSGKEYDAAAAEQAKRYLEE